MKRHKYHIICSWILLICFIAGQYMVYAHQHNTAPIKEKFHFVSQNQPKQILKEKCDLCDAMHHHSMAITNFVYFNPAKVTGYIFNHREYNFRSIQLILSVDRGPPLFNLNS